MKPTLAYERQQPTIKVPKDFVLIQDTREQKPLFHESDMVIEKALKVGDYSIVGFDEQITIERKSIPDLYGSVKRPSFERRVERMLGYKWAGLMIEGTEDDVMRKQMYGKMGPKQIYGALASYEIQGIHIYFAGRKRDARNWIMTRLIKFYNYYREGK